MVINRSLFFCPLDCSSFLIAVLFTQTSSVSCGGYTPPPCPVFFLLFPPPLVFPSVSVSVCVFLGVASGFPLTCQITPPPVPHLPFNLCCLKYSSSAFLVLTMLQPGSASPVLRLSLLSFIITANALNH